MKSELQTKTRPWWQVPLLLLVCLLGGSGGVWADSDFTSSIKVLQTKPTQAAPYFELSMIYYDWTTGSNSFWREGPEILVDDIVVGRITMLDQYNDKDDYGNDGSGWGEKARDDVYSNPSLSGGDARWWDGSEFSRIFNGVMYYVRLRNPNESCTTWNHRQFSVHMRVYINGLEVGSQHTISIRGKWIRKGSNTVDNINWKSSTFRVDDYFFDSYQPKAEMTNYNTVKVSGTLNGSIGPTKVCFFKDDEGGVPDYFVVPNNLTSVQEYAYGSTSFSGHTGTHIRNADNQADGSTMAVEYLLPKEDNGFTTYFYKWYNVNVPGFVKPKEVKAVINTSNMWNKSIRLEWQADESDSRSKQGRWYVYRDGVLLTNNGLDYSQRSFTDETPEYEKDYNYKVAFVPTNTPSGTKYDKLSVTIPAKLERKWYFENFTGTLVDNNAHIKLSWVHNAIGDASGTKTYVLYLYRSTDNKTWGSPIYSTTISSPSTTTGSYIDTDQALRSNHTYYYKLLINLLGGKDFDALSGAITLGGSQLTSFTASRGEYNNVVKLAWTVKQVGGDETTFVVARRPLGTEGEKGWQNIHTTSGTGSSYSYDDITALPGTYNEYRVSIVDNDNRDKIYGSMNTDGFTFATGVISGRVIYGTGTAVKDVKIKLKQQGNGGDLTTAGMRSLQFQGFGAGMAYYTDNAEIQELFGGDFSVQLFVKPVREEMASNNQDYIVFDAVNIFTIRLWYNAVDSTFTVGGWMGGNEKTPFKIKATEWSQLTFVHSHANKKTDVYVATASADSIQEATILSGKQVAWTGLALNANTVAIGNGSTMTNTNNYRGYVDEFRLFTKALTKDEIKQNYNHPLAGNENGLAIYYPFDEGLKKQTISYDYSKTNGVANGRHARCDVPAFSSSEQPSEDQLCLMNYTDSLGNYTIRGIHFQGEGTAYSVIPEYTIHEFSPAARSCFVSMSSLVHSGIDFDDISSFPVSGKVVYSGTNYPVEDVYFYVDGTVCTKDGQMITTNEKGEYEISVPIGNHSISIVKDGHVFVNNGRYPADPNGTGTTINFDKEIKGLDFRDTTLVNFTGRVVGGDIQASKPVGGGLSKNNIGVSELVLTPMRSGVSLNVIKSSGTAVDYEKNPETVPVLSDTIAIGSTSWRGAGDDDSNKIFIHTDPLTGEFSALIPPIEYNVSPIKLVGGNQTEVGEATTVDLSNARKEAYDTLYVGINDFTVYKYHTKLVQAYHATPSFTVKQKDSSNGEFGISKYTYSDDVTKQELDIYSIDTDGNVTYNYGDGGNGNGLPLFIQEDPYTFELYGFEQYVNVDNNETDEVPLAGSTVTINNALSDIQAVYADNGQLIELVSNQLQLDSAGYASYYWKAGKPNITQPYWRTITMTYDINGRQYDWRPGNDVGMKAIVLGNLPTGNNFVTSGPDRLLTILRDPPGTGSSASWEYGTVNTVTTSEGTVWSENAEAGTTLHFGGDLVTFEGVGAGKITTLDSDDDQVIYALIQNEGENSTTTTTTTTITHSVSTSDDPGFVGAQGDVFIGVATNIIFGNARNVGLKKDQEGNFDLGVRETLVTGLEFKTAFNYTQNYIKNYLFPNYEKMKRSLLTPATEAEIKSFKNTKSHPVYLTTLSPDDEDYGKDGTYVGFCPGNANFTETDNLTDIIKEGLANHTLYADSIKWINMQIANWKTYLALNEQEKVEAFENRDNRMKVAANDNYSFDAGSRVSHSIEKESVHVTSWDETISAGLLLENEFGFKFDGFGFDIHLHNEATGGKHNVEEHENDSIQSYSFELVEEGSDAISVDVYQYGAYGPIFRTRGGQTSNPYEGEVCTDYYKVNNVRPVIMEATMQIEVPTINVDVPVVSDIPTGSAANYTLRLGNESEIGEDVAYKIFVLDETNPDGAQLSIDGKVLTEGRLIKVPGNQSLTKTLQLRQTNTSILDYEGNKNTDHELYGKGIGIVFASESQPEDIADTIFIKAYFTPSSSPVTLALSNRTMNTQTGGNLTLTIKDFDRNYHNLKAFRLQYKQPGATDWTLLHEYVLNSDDMASSDNSELLPATGASVSYTKPLTSWSDGDYIFRVASVATYGNSEVYRYSDEVALVKDMQRPRPLGQPEPSDGVLDIGDELSILFNENILRGELSPEINFLVTGVLNGAEVAHETALRLDGNASERSNAQTEANINLAHKDFSIDTWVNITGAGTLLSHGQSSNKLTVGTDADGKLVVKIGNNTYTSTNSVPTGKWAFLTMNVTADGKLTATVASADETVSLFSNKEVAAYAGNGPLSVGCGGAAAMHELLLWDEAHDMTIALLNRSKNKNPSTRHLIGYWKMDEGEGKSIRDYARSRNMTMPNESWYLNNENKAVTLDGEHYVSIDVASLPTTTADDYAVEFWMRGGEQTGSTQLMQMGDVALWLNADGELQLTGKGAFSQTAETNSQFSIVNTQLTDNAWHHIALNVLRQGAAAVYVDGVRRLTTNAANVGNIVTNKLIVGARRVSNYTTDDSNPTYTYDKAFKGEIDEVRIWGATMTGDQLIKNRKVRFTGTEPGLIAYYPFETKTTDDYNQIVTVGTPKDLTESGLSAEVKSLSSQLSTLNYTDEAPSLRTKPVETNVSFTFTASSNKIVIDIDEDPATIEGCTLNFTVRSVRDENGNYSEPAVWSAFVNRNELVWADDAINVTQHVETGSNVTATIVNKGGKQQMWTLDGMPSWLTASSEYGTTNPRSETTVTFTVSPATPIGKYEETVYLKGNDGIETPLTISVKVTGDEPAWTLNPADFDESMNVIGNLFILDQMSEDEDDMVGAFINNECRGVAHPEYDERYDSYFVTMNIYGSSEKDIDAQGDPLPIEFKAYDASTGIIYPVVKTYAVSTEETVIDFVGNELVGRYAAPMKLAATDEVEQNIDLAQGWNWMSLGVKPGSKPEDFTLETVYEKADGRVEFVKTKGKMAEYIGGDWLIDGLTQMNNSEMYAVQTNEAFTLNVTGHRVDSSQEPISVVEGWSWVAYNSLSVMSPAEALAGMQPQDDEIIKGQHGVAYYDRYEWKGNLKQLTPGQGYKIQGKLARTFTYPVKTATAGARSFNSFTSSSPQLPNASAFTPVDYHLYPGNMVLVAQLVLDGQPVEGVELGIFAGEECREAAFSDERGLVITTIPGDKPCELSFRVSDGNSSETYMASVTVTYENDAVIGTPKAPFIIDLGEATGIVQLVATESQQTGQVFDMQGRKVELNDQGRKLRKGVYIVNGQKTVK